jgi:Zn-dependent peptidase ImmA (M78 family)
MPGLDTNVGAKRARQARVALGLDAAAPIDRLLGTVEDRAAVPVLVARLDDGIAGCCVRDGNWAMVFVNGEHALARQRFTLAHEYGHVFCAHATSIDTLDVIAGRTRDPREVQANAFAAEFLAPRAGIERLTGCSEPDLETVVRIAAHFGISAIAALNRLSTLGRTARYERLKDEIEDGDHRRIWDYLALEHREDDLARAGAELPRLSPALRGSALGAMLHGDAPVAGPPALRRALALITR